MNEMSKILEDVCQNYPTKAPNKLVEKFIKSLQEKQVEVERPTNLAAKYFVGRKKNEVLILAHESTKMDWWAVNKPIIDRIINENFLWGIALLDGDCRGFWIPGENFFKLTEGGIVTLGKAGQYHFNKSLLEKMPNLVFSFFTVPKFLKLSGLE